MFDLRSLPKQLIVIGGGPIGLELAQAFRRLGSDVTVLEAARPLAKDDPECAQLVLDQIERDGVTIRSGVNIAAVAKNRNKVIVTLAGGDATPHETIEGTHLIVAAGRHPTIDGLDLRRDPALVHHP